MIETLSLFWESLTFSKIAIGFSVLLISVAISYGAVILVIVQIPADYFSPAYSRDLHSDKPFLVRWGAVIFKNIVGVILLIAGIVMLFVPGPGILAILLGIIMMDIPGKRPLEARLIQRPAVLTAINNLRSRYNKPPLILD